MNKNFWQKIKKPVMMLAPMADVTDAAFRRLIAARGKPDVVWTEFVSADGLCFADSVGRAKLLKDLIYTEAERPIVAQFFTSKPANMEKVSALAAELGFDGIDINMGCPDKSIEKQGAGAALIKTPKLAREIIAAAKRGANGLPVSVKTRVGFNKSELEIWLPELLAEEPAAITIHARTRKEMSKVPARWEEVKRAVEIRNELKSSTLIFGNGDVNNLAEAEEKIRQTDADGVMLGRAIFGNPWLFDRTRAKDKFDERGLVSGINTDAVGVVIGISIKERLETLIEHTKLFEEILGDVKNFAIMKKHFKAYVNGWDGAKELRAELMETQNFAGVQEIIKKYLENHKNY